MDYELKKCFLCGDTNHLQTHHLFSNSKINRKIYGGLIEDERNKILLCFSCHMSKPIPKFTEQEFCAALGIKPMSKILTRAK